MAKDKIKEAAYKLEGLKRNEKRKKTRLENFINKKENNRNGICNTCYREMEWCEGCNMWSCTHCEEYGTCMCS